MSSPANFLYDEQIVEHSKKPRNHRRMENANRFAEGHNPLCGDHQIVYLLVEDDVIKDISFLSVGADSVKNCAISKASASMMTKALKGKNLPEVETLFAEFHQMLTSATLEEVTPILGHLRVFAGVREFPMRVKCATLPWHTLKAALNQESIVSTE
ncbi:MAG TPA: SUF system NifU family Fe-S cluster assembly protein [Pyrinomonadaceae bacterium]|nr:SUF system NifU family Fe-S cluster assembly protein [Pyrinomonadaceae bacterium]